MKKTTKRRILSILVQQECGKQERCCAETMHGRCATFFKLNSQENKNNAVIKPCISVHGGGCYIVSLAIFNLSNDSKLKNFRYIHQSYNLNKQRGGKKKKKKQASFQSKLSHSCFCPSVMNLCYSTLTKDFPNNAKKKKNCYKVKDQNYPLYAFKHIPSSPRLMSVTFTLLYY